MSFYPEDEHQVGKCHAQVQLAGQAEISRIWAWERRQLELGRKEEGPNPSVPNSLPVKLLSFLLSSTPQMDLIKSTALEEEYRIQGVGWYHTGLHQNTWPVYLGQASICISEGSVWWAEHHCRKCPGDTDYLRTGRLWHQSIHGRALLGKER